MGHQEYLAFFLQVVGLIAVMVGLYWIYPPLGMIFGGAILLMWGVGVYIESKEK